VPDVWAWVERVSWVATLVGLPFVLIPVYLLWRDQRRLARELTRRPVIEFGFIPDDSVEPPRPLPREMTVSPRWTPGTTVSEQVDVMLAARNVGSRTARELIFNVWVPARPGLPAARDQDPVAVPVMNPGVVQPFPKKFSFREGQTALPVVATVTMTDSEEQRFELRIIVAR